MCLWACELVTRFFTVQIKMSLLPVQSNRRLTNVVSIHPEMYENIVSHLISFTYSEQVISLRIVVLKLKISPIISHSKIH